MYKVIKYFTDLQDKNHAYNVGDIFPREGLNVSQKRLKELLGPNNKQHKPLIEEVPDPIEEVPDPIEEKPIDDVVEIKPTSKRKRK